MMQSRRAGEWIVTAYFDARPNSFRLGAFCAEAIGHNSDPKVTELPDQDWVAKSLAGLGPVRAGRFLVHGSHDRDHRKSNKITVEIDAATAFGTGHHDTTAGCLRALSELAKSRSPGSALDIGVGSGVLAIAIAKTWRVPVVATDIDPAAIGVATANARINQVTRNVTAHHADGLAHSLVRRAAPFDLVTTNILAGPLASLAGAVAAHLAPGGTAILSGLLPSQRRWIMAAYRAHGLVLGGAPVVDGWLTLILQRPPFAGRSPRA